LEDLKKSNEKESKKMWKKWGELANKWGTLVEDLVAPNVPTIAEDDFHCSELIDFMIRRKKRSVKERSKLKEFDVIAVCLAKVILVDVKSTPKIDYINEFIETVGEFLDFFPEHSDKELIPIFASINIPKNVEKYLTKNRIYAMASGDETMEIINLDEMKALS
jgi:hypothetical protein